MLMLVCRLGALRQIRWKLRGSALDRTFLVLFGAPGVPHGDTLNLAFQNLRPDDLQEVVCSMLETLIRKKVLYPFRLLDRWFTVALDATGCVTFHERHCDHCLTRKSGSTILYYHNVLEAKLVARTGLALSLMTEFIENEAPDVSKQDCELNAFRRPAPRLKQRFPRLPLCLLMDGLYACGPAFSVCKAMGWKFIVSLKDGSLPSVHAEFHGLTALHPENNLIRTNPQKNPHQVFRWMADIPYVDTRKLSHVLHVVECRETKPAEKSELKTTRFVWASNIKPDQKTSRPSPTMEGGCAGKLKTRASTSRKTGDTGWSTPTARIKPRPKSFISCFRSPKRSCNRSIGEAFSPKLSPRASAA